MTTFAVLLRGINVGGRNRLPMTDLRASLEAEGLRAVRTYIQSGNIVLEGTGTEMAMAGRVRRIITASSGLDIPVVALTARALDDLAAANPFAEEPDPKKVHAIVMPDTVTAPTVAAVGERVAAARARGSRDDARAIGRTVYLHTPDGFGRSDLAAKLASGSSAPLRDGTARNWATVAALIDLCSH